MLILPNPPRRAWLISFWIASCLSLGLLVGLVLAVLVSPLWFGIGLLLAFILSVPGLLWPHAVLVPYKLWGRVTLFYARAARVLLKGICFYLVIFPVALAGSSLRLARPVTSESQWIPRRIAEPVTHQREFNGRTREQSQAGWIKDYLSWAAEPSNWWSVCLLPFLTILLAMSTDEEHDFPANIYTLF